MKSLPFRLPVPIFMKESAILFFPVLLALAPASSRAQWVQVSNGMGNRTVNALTANQEYLFAGTGSGGVYRSTNGGTSWDPTSLNSGTVYSLAVDGNYAFAGTGNTGVYMSTDNGANWAQSLLTSSVVTSLTINGNSVFAGQWNVGVWKSTNKGTSWSSTSLTGFVLSLAVDADTIYAGRYSNIRPIRGVYKSTNNGANWALTSLSDQYVPSLALKGNTVFAGTSSPGNGVYMSTNSGTSWDQTSLNNQEVRSLAVTANSVFAGTRDSGIFVSHDNGTSWTQKNEGLGNSTVYALYILNEYIFAGTDGNSVYRRPVSELTSVEQVSHEIPNNFSLAQNYPNPFNPSTKIVYQVKSRESIELNVFDVLGRKVATLVNEVKSPGT